MEHWVLEYYQDYSNDDIGLTMTLLRQGQIWENTNTQDFMESFIIVVLIRT